MKRDRGTKARSRFSFRRVIGDWTWPVIMRKQLRQLQVSLLAYQNYGNVVRLLWSCSWEGERGTAGLFIARARFAIVPSILMHN